MRRFLTLLSKELGSYFKSPIGYAVMVFILLLTGFTFTSGVSILNRGPSEVTVVEAFFNTVIFWFGFVLIFPLITMRTFSEEFKMGTIESLMTAPVRDIQVLLAKYLGSLFFYIILWIPSILYFILFEEITGYEAAGAVGAYWGSYLLILLMGMFYISIGVFASALTSNQIVAAAITFFIVTIFFFIGLLAFFVLNISPVLRDITGYFSAIEHMREFSQGMIDSRPIIFYTSMTIFVLFLTFQVFQYRKWKS